MDSNTKKSVEQILTRCILRTIDRLKKEKSYKPFHEALLSKELVLASSFERSFSTSFGQGAVEEISIIIAKSTGAVCARQKETHVNIYKGAMDEITRILGNLREGRSAPDWSTEVKRICAVNKGDTIIHRVISDLWIKQDDKETFISIKTVKPNLDQTEIAKRDMLLLKADNSQRNVYFGLFYNPGGNLKSDYNWNIPNKIFNMIDDECVLIGQEYWDYIGGAQTYSQLLEVFETVGCETRNLLSKL